MNTHTIYWICLNLFSKKNYINLRTPNFYILKIMIMKILKYIRFN